VSYLLDTNVCIALINGNLTKSASITLKQRAAMLSSSPPIVAMSFGTELQRVTAFHKIQPSCNLSGRDVVLSATPIKIPGAGEIRRSWNGRARGLANMTRSSPVSVRQESDPRHRKYE